MSQTSNPHKNFYGKKRRRKKKLTNMDRRTMRLANQVVEQKLSRVQELKLYDKEIQPGTNVSSSGFLTILTNTISPGDGPTNREGASVMMKSLLVRYNLIGADTTNILRVIIFRWLDDTMPVVTSVLDVLSTSLIVWPTCPINFDNRKKISVLYDQLHALTDTASNSSQVEKLYIKRNLKINWKKDNSEDGGHIYLLAISDSTGLSHPTIHAQSRLRFTDS